MIAKPFTYQGLAQKIADALDAGRRPGSACGWSRRSWAAAATRWSTWLEPTWFA